MIQTPTTYSQWVSVLDMLRDKKDDEGVLRAMKAGAIEWQPGVAERFAKKLTDTVNHRMNAATDRFQKAMNNARGQESQIVQALLALRKEMAFLAAAINLDAIPAKDRRQYHQLVLQQADSIQESLEESAARDRTGKMLSIVRNHKINA